MEKTESNCPHSATAVKRLSDDVCGILDDVGYADEKHLPCVNNNRRNRLRSLSLHLRDVLKHYVSLLEEDNEIDVPHSDEGLGPVALYLKRGGKILQERRPGGAK